MLTDREAEEIERQLGRGVRSGPLVLSWVNKLLADRKERVGQIHHVRQRLNQAFRYLDGLLRDLPNRPPTAPKPGPTCGRCGKPYARAYGISPRGMAYVHADGKECRMEAP